MVAVILSSLLWACAFMFLRYVLSSEDWTFLSKRMGAVNWDISNSWASTLTGLGAILTAVISVQVLPQSTDTQPITKGYFAVLGALFVAIIAFAVLIYNATRRPIEGVHSLNPNDPNTLNVGTQYQGYVGIFFVASTMVLWAAIGQLITIGLFLIELARPLKALPTTPPTPPPITTPPLPVGFVVIFVILILIALIAVHVYCWISIPWTIQNQIDRTQQLSETIERKANEGELIRPAELDLENLNPARPKAALP